MKYLGAHVSASGGVENAPSMHTKLGQMHLPFLPKTNVSGFQLH